MMEDKRRRQLAIASVLVLGLLAILQHWLTARRPLRPELRAAREFIVDSSADQGSGSLREAIFFADSGHERVRIVLRAKRITLQSPLPPLVNPLGIVVEASPQGGQIDARGIGMGAVFDVDAPGSVMTGVSVLNAPEQGILVRKDGFRLQDTKLAACNEGLRAMDSVRNLVLERTTFEGNRVGVLLASAGSGISLRNNRFNNHKDAAIWAVLGKPIVAAAFTPVEIRGNYFEGDRMSVVLGNFPALVEGNEFVKALETAVFLLGDNAVVRNNRVRNGAGVGVFAQMTQGTVIEGNELDHNRALAVLVRSSRDAVVRDNRAYENGYGIGFVLGPAQSPNVALENTLLSQQYDAMIVIGESPLISRNRALNSSLAGLRILDFYPAGGGRVASSPLLKNNTVQGNKYDEVVRGEYRAPNREGIR